MYFIFGVKWNYSSYLILIHPILFDSLFVILFFIYIDMSSGGVYPPQPSLHDNSGKGISGKKKMICC